MNTNPVVNKILLSSILFFTTFIASAQIEPANYKEIVRRFTKFYNDGLPDSIFSLLNAQTQLALPLEKTRQVSQQLKAQLGNISTTEFKSIENETALYKTTFTNGIFALKIGLDAKQKMTGLLVQPYQEQKANVLDQSLVETHFLTQVEDANLSGTFMLPKNIAKKIPVVLIIAGSGATDRNGNTAGAVSANTYYLLAEALAKAGIASLRYDKRAIGSSTYTKTESALRFDHYVNDAVAIIKLLKADTQFSKVIVAGHSEGSLIGMLAAAKEKTSGFISLAGAGDAANNVLKIQLKKQPATDNGINLKRLDSLSKGKLVTASSTDALFRPAIQPYLISWFKYNPAEEIKKVNAPVLIVQGTTDLQVSTEDAQNLKRAKADARLQLIEGMNHVLKDAPEDRAQNIATYTNPLLPANTKLVETLVQFIQQQQ